VGWRPTFVVIGSLGFVWVGAWLFLVRGERSEVLAGRITETDANTKSPARHPSYRSPAMIGFAIVGLAAIASACLAVQYGPTAVWVAIALAMLGTLAVAACLPKDELAGLSWATSLHEVARIPRFWVLVVVSVTINIPWHFLVNWLPAVLKNDRLMSQSAAGYLTAATFLAADAGNLGGGFLSRSLAGRGMPVVRARKTAMALCMLLILAGPAVSVAHADYVVIALIATMAAGIAAFLANYFSFTQEISARHTGLISGYLGGLGNLAVAAYVPFAGALRDRTGSFAASFFIVGLAPLVGITVLFMGWREREVASKAAPLGGDDG
jgi:ACS family hexuronate transporter-like MFS transporter